MTKKEKKKAKEARRKEKKEKEAKERKDREKREREDTRARAKEEKARVRKVHTDANKVLAKIASPMLQLGEAMKDPNWSHIPTWASKKAKAAREKLSDYDVEAKQKLSESNPAELTFDLQTVQDVAKSAMETKSLVLSFLSAARKHVS